MKGAKLVVANDELLIHKNKTKLMFH